MHTPPPRRLLEKVAALTLAHGLPNLAPQLVAHAEDLLHMVQETGEPRDALLSAVEWFIGRVDALVSDLSRSLLPPNHMRFQVLELLFTYLQETCTLSDVYFAYSCKHGRHPTPPSQDRPAWPLDDLLLAVFQMAKCKLDRVPAPCAGESEGLAALVDALAACSSSAQLGVLLRAGPVDAMVRTLLPPRVPAADAAAIVAANLLLYPEAAETDDCAGQKAEIARKQKHLARLNGAIAAARPRVEQDETRVQQLLAALRAPVVPVPVPAPVVVVEASTREEAVRQLVREKVRADRMEQLCSERAADYNAVRDDVVRMRAGFTRKIDELACRTTDVPAVPDDEIPPPMVHEPLPYALHESIAPLQDAIGVVDRMFTHLRWHPTLPAVDGVALLRWADAQEEHRDAQTHEHRFRRAYSRLARKSGGIAPCMLAVDGTLSPKWVKDTAVVDFVKNFDALGRLHRACILLDSHRMSPFYAVALSLHLKESPDTPGASKRRMMICGYTRDKFFCMAPIMAGHALCSAHKTAIP